MACKELPQWGYRMNLLLALLLATGLVSPETCEMSTRLPFAEGTCTGLAKVLGVSAKHLQTRPHLAMLYIRMIQDEIPALWRQYSSLPAPPFSKWTLVVQLCNYKRSGFKSGVFIPPSSLAAVQS